jgi:MtN3 and saliva related transmembrane protein
VSGIGVEAIGWLSSALLVVTLVHQVRKQWKSGHSEGVSRWLFLGQLAASFGFFVYSTLLGSWVFVVTNALLVVNALVGYAIVRHHRKGKKEDNAAALSARRRSNDQLRLASSIKRSGR